MQQRPRTAEPAPRPRIVDVIAEGLSLVLVRPWLLLIPILLDIAIWIGVKIEPRNLVNALIDFADDASMTETEDLIATLQDLAGVNMTQLGALFVPSMLAGASSNDIYQLVDQRVWTPSSGVVFLVALGLIVAGSLLSMIYTVPIANAILGRKLGIGGNAGLILRSWLRMLLFIGLVVGGLMMLVIPAALMSAIFTPLLPLFSSVLLIGAFAALILLYFVFDAIVIADVGPIAAIKYSVAIVRGNLRSVIGLILATLLLTTGIPEIVSSLLGSLPGLIAAVVLQAVIATGVTAASMFFFVDRLRQWQPDLIELPQSAPAFDLTR